MLTTSIVQVDQISDVERTEMLNLMRLYYENVSDERFDSDLAAKDSVIRLWNGEELCGFTTQVLTPYRFLGQTIRILFSGDTIVAGQYRNSFAIPIAWGRMMLSILKRAPDEALLWLLTAKGYKSFRYLSVFFKDYYPRPNRGKTELENAVLSTVVRDMFDGRYDSERGILRAGPTDQRLMPGVADITASRRQKEEIAYFELMNPCHAAGDELVCLARFEESNLTPFILRKMLAS